MKIAGIDVHKKVLMVVLVDASAPEEKPARRRFVMLPSELQRFRNGCSGSRQALCRKGSRHRRPSSGGVCHLESLPFADLHASRRATAASE